MICLVKVKEFFCKVVCFLFLFFEKMKIFEKPLCVLKDVKLGQVTPRKLRHLQCEVDILHEV